MIESKVNLWMPSMSFPAKLGANSSSGQDSLSSLIVMIFSPGSWYVLSMSYCSLAAFISASKSWATLHFSSLIFLTISRSPVVVPVKLDSLFMSISYKCTVKSLPDNGIISIACEIAYPSQCKKVIYLHRWALCV